MKINVVGKNVTVTQGISDKIHKKLEVLNKYFIVGDEDTANVLIRTYRHKQKIEVTIPTKFAILRAEVMDDDLYNAVDKVIDKLEDQIRRQKTRLTRKNKDSLAQAFIDEVDDDLEQGQLLRINKGESDFDASYNIINNEGKICTLQYLGNGKALIYSENATLENQENPYCMKYSIVDLKTGKRTPLTYKGEEVGYNSGRFSQRSVVVDGKAYIGVNTETSTCIYIYDIATGTTEKGADIAQGYYFDVLRVVEN